MRKDSILLLTQYGIGGILIANQKRKIKRVILDVP